MTVLSKVLYGKLAVRSFTPVASIRNKLTLESSPFSSNSASVSSSSGNSKSDKVINTKPGSLSFSIPIIQDEELTKSVDDDAWYLTPAERNYHEFKALSTCIVFDILLPPYHETDRLCTYYEYNLKKQTLDICKSPRNEDLPYNIRYRGYQPS